jgi:hypothetical protein
MDRQRQGAQGDLRDQAEGAPAAGEQTHQVVTGHVLHHPAPGSGRHPVGPQQAQADQLVTHPQVALAIAPGHAAGHQATDAAWRLPPGGIEGEPLAMGGEGLLHRRQGGARLHREGEVAGIVLDDPIEAGAAHDLRGLGEGRPPVEAAAQAGRQPGTALLVQVPHQLRQFVGLGTHHGTMVPWRRRRLN